MFVAKEDEDARGLRVEAGLIALAAFSMMITRKKTHEEGACLTLWEA